MELSRGPRTTDHGLAPVVPWAAGTKPPAPRPCPALPAMAIPSSAAARAAVGTNTPSPSGTDNQGCAMSSVKIDTAEPLRARQNIALTHPLDHGALQGNHDLHESNQ